MPLALIVLAVVFALAVAGLVVAAIGWYGSEKALKPPPWREPHSFEEFGIAPETVSFQSRDGLRLNGGFLRGSNSATIILCHGYGRSLEEMIPHADYLNRAGFSCLLFDQRSRGASEGRYASVGALERWDVMGAVDYLAGRAEIDMERVGILGMSGGAAAALLAAAEEPRLAAIAVESCFANVREVVAQSFKHFIGLPAFPFADATLKVSELRLGYSASILAPEKVVGSIAPRPILFMHGDEDTAIPCGASEAMYALAGEPRELWLIAGAGHAKGHATVGKEYEERVIAFFGQHLLARTVGAGLVGAPQS